MSRFDRSELETPAVPRELDATTVVGCVALAVVDASGAMTGMDMVSLEGFSSSNSERSRFIDDMVGMRVEANCVLVAVLAAVVAFAWTFWELLAIVLISM